MTGDFSKLQSDNDLVMSQKEKIGVLFVCLGNICRSPMAEGHFIRHVEEAGLSELFYIDSAGTNGLHDGEKADRRMRETARGHGMELHSISRQVKLDDFKDFNHIVAMDHHNLQTLEKWQAKVPGSQARLHLMRDFDEGFEGVGVPDPYYGGMDGFEEVYQILHRSTLRFLDGLKAQLDG